MADLFFCPSCKALQAYPEKTDYFRCFGLGRHLQMDPEKLEETFHDLSRKFHPDFYQRKSQEEQQISLENAAILNKAYQTLKDPMKRAAYLIGLFEGGRNITAEAPADLFEEIFALQEGLEELKTLDPEASDLKLNLFSNLKITMETLQSRQKEALREIEAFFPQWDMLSPPDKDQDFTTQQMDCLQNMKKILSQQAYLERMIKNIRSAIGGR
jgi:molecular chaperone HscB